MTEERAARHSGSEFRLLAITIVVSVMMLFLLARLRFPERAERTAEPQPAPAAPLARLAARATYDELASILRRIDRQAATAVSPARGNIEGADGKPVEVVVPAVRLAEEYAVALFGPQRQPAAGGATPVVFDAPRGLALLPSADRAGVSPVALAEVDAVAVGPGYLASVEATEHGPAVRPMYYGRVDRESDSRWESEVLRFSGLQQLPPPGAAVFTLQGEFVGAGLPDGQDFVVVPASALARTAARLLAGGPVAAMGLGLSVQPLDAALRAATGAAGGVIVADVAEGGPAAGLIEPGDVIVAVDGTRIETTADYEAAAARLRAAAVTVEILRDGTPASVSVVPAALSTEHAPVNGIGMALRSVRGRGAEVLRVDAGGAAAGAGILAGDVIARIGRAEAPAAPVVERAYRDAASGTTILVRLRRGDRHLFVALPKR
jgi:hypothetical protein